MFNNLSRFKHDYASHNTKGGPNDILFLISKVMLQLSTYAHAFTQISLTRHQSYLCNSMHTTCVLNNKQRPIESSVHQFSANYTTDTIETTLNGITRLTWTIIYYNIHILSQGTIGIFDFVNIDFAFAKRFVFYFIVYKCTSWTVMDVSRVIWTRFFKNVFSFSTSRTHIVRVLVSILAHRLCVRACAQMVLVPMKSNNCAVNTKRWANVVPTLASRSRPHADVAPTSHVYWVG